MSFLKDIFPDKKIRYIFISVVIIFLLMIGVLITMMIGFFNEDSGAKEINQVVIEQNENTKKVKEKEKYESLNLPIELNGEIYEKQNEIMLGNLKFSIPELTKEQTFDRFNMNITDIKGTIALQSSGFDGVFYQNLNTQKTKQVTDISTFSYLSEDGKRVYFAEPSVTGEIGVFQYDIETEDKKYLFSYTNQEVLLDFVEIDKDSGVYIINSFKDKQPLIKTYVSSDKVLDYTPSFQNFTQKPGINAFLERDKDNIYLVQNDSVFLWKVEKFVKTMDLPIGYNLIDVDVNEGLVTALVQKGDNTYVLANGKLISNSENTFSVKSYDKNHLLLLQRNTLKLVNIVNNESVVLSEEAVDMFQSHQDIFFHIQIEEHAHDAGEQHSGEISRLNIVKRIN